jgi:hypothetical protein
MAGRRSKVSLTTPCTRGGSAAEVRLSGTQDRVVLQMRDATMPEIFAALRSAFDLEVKLAHLAASALCRFSGPSLAQKGSSITLVAG